MNLNFSNTEKISAIPDPLTWTDAKKQLMVDACREMARFQMANNREIEHLYKSSGFDPESLKEEKDLLRIPSLGVTAMKYFLITTLAHETAVLKLTSSGTRGQKTQIWFDQGSLDRVQRMLDVYLEQEGLVSKELTNYLVFNYDPDDAKNLGVAFTEKNQLRFAPCNEVFYSIRKNKEDAWVFEKEKALEVLNRYARDDKPVRIFGMPGFIHEFLNFLRENNVHPFKLPKGSCIWTGGGWKAAEDKKISREEFRAFCSEAFGISAEMQRDAYGMAEHCAPYFECSHHRFHVAVFNRVIIRDPVTLAPLENGNVGLMELVTPFNAMMPTLAILTTDYGMIDAEPCTCGWNAPTFSLHGRAGVAKHKGCAITAHEIVKRTGDSK